MQGVSCFNCSHKIIKIFLAHFAHSVFTCVALAKAGLVVGPLWTSVCPYMFTIHYEVCKLYRRFSEARVRVAWFYGVKMGLLG